MWSRRDQSAMLVPDRQSVVHTGLMGRSQQLRGASGMVLGHVAVGLLGVLSLVGAQTVILFMRS